ncbi:MAG: CYTH domain-containing protein [Thiohalocapsa sp.]|jgi:adenylate cyclase|nr:CYTH domain-containing protein [Thiohalocapsa sp.]MCF7989906.1 CYTH domain-containing protein [Thiohalocapsa sp.]
MPTEIERKFLVTGESWRDAVVSEARLMQGYLTTDRSTTVRVRIKNDSAVLTIKGPSQGISRAEFEYPIPSDDAEQMLRDLAVSAPIEKTRYRVRCGAHVWDLDVFAGENAGLVMAEVELTDEDEAFDMPEWAGEEVSGDPRYYNSNLARNPYRHW